MSWLERFMQADDALADSTEHRIGSPVDEILRQDMERMQRAEREMLRDYIPLADQSRHAAQRLIDCYKALLSTEDVAHLERVAASHGAAYPAAAVTSALRGVARASIASNQTPENLPTAVAEQIREDIRRDNHRIIQGDGLGFQFQIGNESYLQHKPIHEQYAAKLDELERQNTNAVNVMVVLIARQLHSSGADLALQRAALNHGESNAVRALTHAITRVAVRTLDEGHWPEDLIASVRGQIVAVPATPSPLLEGGSNVVIGDFGRGSHKR